MTELSGVLGQTSFPPHAGALDFLVKWYSLPANQRHTPSLEGQGGMDKILAEGAQIAAFLDLDYTATATTILWRWGQVTDQVTGSPVIPLPAGGSEMVQLADNQDVTFKIDAKDSKGYDVAGENFTATIDNPAVATLTGPDATSGEFTISSVAPGSAVVTATDGTLSVTAAVDVVTGGVALLDLTFDAPTDQSAPTPVPDPVTPDPAPVDPNA